MIITESNKKVEYLYKKSENQARIDVEKIKKNVDLEIKEIKESTKNKINKAVDVIINEIKREE
jgi:hypothetical protein